MISDIHANLPALEAVLAAIDAAGVEEIWCLGDVVGYGAEPDACADLVRERCSLCLVGNHDLAVLGVLDASAFSEAAAEAVAWTRDNVADRTWRCCASWSRPDGATASPSSTPRRATRSGSTSSRPSRRTPASTSSPSGSR